MTPTDEELVRWSAEVLMGWDDYLLDYFDHADDIGSIKIPNPKYKNWNPLDKSNGQIWEVVDAMDKRGWWLFWNNEENVAEFYKKDSDRIERAKDETFNKAILLSAWWAVEGK